MTTYTRKYYLIREIKRAGFDLDKSQRERMILIPITLIDEAGKNKYLNELIKKFEYGAQIVSNLAEPQKLIETHELIAACNNIIAEKLSLFKRFRMMMKSLIIHELHK